MKFFTLLTTLSAVAKVAFASYCGVQCDPNKVPETPLSGPLTLVAVIDNKDKNIKYKVAGTVVIENDCVFTVKGFQLTPKSDAAKWYGASDPYSNEGILLSNEQVGVTANPTDLSYNIKDTSLFCHASLLTDVGNGGVIRLMDENYQLLAFAEIAPGAPSSSGASSAAPAAPAPQQTTTAAPNSDKKTTTTTKKAAETSPTVVQATKPGNDTEAATPVPGAQNPAASKTTKPSGTNGFSSVITGNADQKQGNSNNTSGALSSFKVPSLALYLVLFIIAFIRF